MDEVPLAGGSVSAVVRVGETVRSPRGSWTPAVQVLLRHLESVGFDGAPRALGVDAERREVLSYVEGQAGFLGHWDYRSDDLLVEAARLIRRYHDATVGFVPPPGARWRVQVGAPAPAEGRLRPGEVVCHNDLAPYNTVLIGGRPVCLIDWDFAAPGTRLWDVAYALWRFVPRYGDEWSKTFAGRASARERARRMRLFCDAYGLEGRAGLLDAIERRQRVAYATIAAWGEAGVPGFAEMWTGDRAAGLLADLAYLRRHRRVLSAAL